MLNSVIPQSKITYENYRQAGDSVAMEAIKLFMRGQQEENQSIRFIWIAPTIAVMMAVKEVKNGIDFRIAIESILGVNTNVSDYCINPSHMPAKEYAHFMRMVAHKLYENGSHAMIDLSL